MRVAILMLAFVALSCGPTAKMRKAQRLINEAIAKGAKVDTVLRRTVYDTLLIREINDSFELNFKPKIEFLIQDCADLITAIGNEPTIDDTDIAADGGKVQKAIVKLQKAACPQIAIDSLYDLKLEAQGKTYRLPLRVKISNDGGDFKYSIKAGGLQAPIVRQENDIKIKTGHSTWDLVILSIVIAIVAFLVGRFTK